MVVTNADGLVAPEASGKANSVGTTGRNLNHLCGGATTGGQHIPAHIQVRDDPAADNVEHGMNMI
jgi:hypothetical protein